MNDEKFSASREALPVRRRYSGDRKPVAKQPATIGSDAGPEGNSSPGRSHIAVASDDGSLYSNRAQYSATFSHSNPKTDDLASDAASDQLAELAPSAHHPQGFRQSRKAPGPRAGTPRSYPVSRTVAEHGPGKAGAGYESRLRYSVNSADDLEGGQGPSSQPQHQKLQSSSVMNEGRLPVTVTARRDEVVSLSSASGQPSESSSYGQESAQRLSNEKGPAGKVSTADGEEELINDTQAIYAGLLMVEKRCIALTQHLSQTNAPLSEQEWQRLINTHHVLIEEHHDFLLIIQQGGPALRRLAEQYNMPNRLWRVGIYGLLEFLRHRLPESLERMLAFLHQSYIQMTILVDLVSRFEDTWFECLGDLSRYHILVEESDPREREAWAEIARYWYHKVADKSPDVGRIQHHLAPLARPDYTQQLFYYTKSLVCVHPFAGTKQSILTLFNPILKAPRTMVGLQDTVAVFVTAHAYLFKGDLKDPFLHACNGFLSSLEQYIGRMGSTFKPQGVYISSCNFAAVLEYAAPNALLPSEFFTNAAQSKSMDDIYFASQRFWTQAGDLKAIEADFLETRNSGTISPVVFYASCLTFQALSIMLDQTGNKNVYPSFHASLAFLWCLGRTPSSMKRVEVLVPWKQIATFLNTLTRNFTDFTRIEGFEFPSQGDEKWLPEDFLIRGQVWSQNLYPTGFFNKAPTADEGRNLEPPSRDLERMQRCLWLGTRLATFNRWMTYDITSRKFAATDFASDLADMAQKDNPFFGQNLQTSPKAEYA